MIQITSNFFTAAVVIEEDVVISAAPILRYMVGWTVEKVLWYCGKRGWSYQTIAPDRPVEGETAALSGV